MKDDEHSSATFPESLLSIFLTCDILWLYGCVISWLRPLGIIIILVFFPLLPPFLPITGRRRVFFCLTEEKKRGRGDDRINSSDVSNTFAVRSTSTYLAMVVDYRIVVVSDSNSLSCRQEPAYSTWPALVLGKYN